MVNNINVNKSNLIDHSFEQKELEQAQQGEENASAQASAAASTSRSAGTRKLLAAQANGGVVASTNATAAAATGAPVQDIIGVIETVSVGFSATTLTLNNNGIITVVQIPIGNLIAERTASGQVVRISADQLALGQKVKVNATTRSSPVQASGILVQEGKQSLAGEKVEHGIVISVSANSFVLQQTKRNGQPGADITVNFSPSSTTFLNTNNQTRPYAIQVGNSYQIVGTYSSTTGAITAQAINIPPFA